MTISENRRKPVVLFCQVVLTLFLMLSLPLTARALTPEDAAAVSGKGWMVLPSGKVTYISKDTTPATGFLKLNKYWYHFDEEGYLSLGWFTVGQRRYYATSGGKLGSKKGSLKSGYVGVEGVYYLFSDKDRGGQFGVQQTGWVTLNKDIFYYDPDGTKLFGLQEINGRLYYFAPGGSAKKRGGLRTGWKTIDGEKYYFRTTGKIGRLYGAAYRSTAVKIKGKKYTFGAEGYVSTEQVLTTEAQKKFIDTIGNLARADMQSTGILASITIAQAIVESGWGTSTLAKKAHNLFGMKAALSSSSWKSDWDGSIYKVRTQEYINGSYITILDSFRKYKDYAASVADHSAYLCGAKLTNGKLRYDGVIGCKDYKKAATIIKNGGYATAPNYVPVLVDIIEKYNLTQFDS